MLRRSKTRSLTDNKNLSNADKNDKREGKSAKNLTTRPFEARSPMNHQDTKHSRKLDGKSKGGSAHQYYERYLTQAQEALAMGDRIEAEHYYQRADHWLRICNEGRKNKEERHNNERRQNHQNRDSELQTKKSDLTSSNVDEPASDLMESSSSAHSFNPSKQKKNEIESSKSPEEGIPAKRQGDKKRMTQRKQGTESKTENI